MTGSFYPFFFNVPQKTRLLVILSSKVMLLGDCLFQFTAQVLMLFPRSITLHKAAEEPATCWFPISHTIKKWSCLWYFDNIVTYAFFSFFLHWLPVKSWLQGRPFNCAMDPDTFSCYSFFTMSTKWEKETRQYHTLIHKQVRFALLWCSAYSVSTWVALGCPKRGCYGSFYFI